MKIKLFVSSCMVVSAFSVVQGVDQNNSPIGNQKSPSCFIASDQLNLTLTDMITMLERLAGGPELPKLPGIKCSPWQSNCEKKLFKMERRFQREKDIDSVAKEYNDDFAFCVKVAGGNGNALRSLLGCLKCSRKMPSSFSTLLKDVRNRESTLAKIIEQTGVYSEISKEKCIEELKEIIKENGWNSRGVIDFICSFSEEDLEQNSEQISDYFSLFFDSVKGCGAFAAQSINYTHLAESLRNPNSMIAHEGLLNIAAGVCGAGLRGNLRDSIRDFYLHIADIMRYTEVANVAIRKFSDLIEVKLGIYCKPGRNIKKYEWGDQDDKEIQDKKKRVVKNRICSLDNYCVFIASRYLDTLADHLNLVRVAKRFRGNMEKFHYNPIAIDEQTAKFFPNIETQYLYSSGDCILTLEKIANWRFSTCRKFIDSTDFTKLENRANMANIKIEFPKPVIFNYEHDLCKYIDNYNTLDLRRCDCDVIKIRRKIMLGQNDFYGLEKIVFPNKNVIVGEDAFKLQCTLESITIPLNIQLSRGCFSGCDLLTELNVIMANGEIVSTPIPNQLEIEKVVTDAPNEMTEEKEEITDKTDIIIELLSGLKKIYTGV